MATLLHISADVPDAYNPHKTAAVRNLLALAPTHTHQLYSINRRNGIGGVIDQVTDATCVCLTYQAPPFGLLLRAHLDRLGRWIIADLQQRKVRVDAIHAHKLAVEGIVAEHVARELGVPFAVSLWGNTDQRFVARKPELRATYRRVVDRARVITPAAPWIADALAAPLRLAPDKCAALPIVTTSDAVLPSPLAGPRIVSVFNLDFYVAKGARNLIKAVALANRRGGRAITLDIYGGGSERAKAALTKAIASAGEADRIRLMGPTPHAAVQQIMSGYAGFALPTLSETYGMVYVEALLAGVPILYSAGRGIDGYFDDLDIATRRDCADVADIAAGLLMLVAREAELKANIAAAQGSGALDRFRRPGIAAAYARILDRLLARA